MEFRFVLRAKVLRGALLASILWVAPYQILPLQAQETTESAATAEAETGAVTTGNLQVPIPELELLVRPLELEELQVEAEAWQEILKGKVAEISETEIAIRRQNQIINRREEAARNLELASQELTEAETTLAAATQGSPEFEEATQQVEDARERQRAAQTALEEIEATRAELRQDDSLQGALAEAEQTGILAEARQIVNEAREAREELEAGTPAYEQATERIEALEIAITAVETAQEQQQNATPDTPEFEEATQELTTAREALAQLSEAAASVESNAERVLRQARRAREDLEPGSVAYARASLNIQRLETAIADVQTAQERVDQMDPESPDLEVAQQTLTRAQGDLQQATRAALSLPETARRIRSQRQSELEAIPEGTPEYEAINGRILALSAALDSVESAEQALIEAEADSPEREAAAQALADAEVALANVVETEISELDRARRTLYEGRQANREAGGSGEISQQRLSELEARITAVEELQTRLDELEPEAPEVEQVRADREAAIANLAPARAAAADFSVLLVNAQRLLARAREQQESLAPEAPGYGQVTQAVETLSGAVSTFEGLTEANDGARQSLQQAIAETLAALVPAAESDPTAGVETGDAVVPTPAVGEAEAEEAAEQITEVADELQEQAEVEAELRNRLVETVTELQSQRTALADRLRVVLDELDRKGGDSASYRDYMSAVGLVVLDLEDTEGLGVRIVSWIRSEEGGIRWGINIGMFVGIMIGVSLLCQVLSAVLNLLMDKIGHMSSLLRGFIVTLINRGGIVIGFLVALTALEVSLGPILALLGGASFVLAFALQSNLGNLASGLMLMVAKPFDVNDEVQIAGNWGLVDSITLATTRLKVWGQGKVINIPNNTVWNGTIINLTAPDGIRKVVEKINVDPNADLDRVKDIMQEVLDAHPLILRDYWYGSFLWAYGDYAEIFYAARVTENDYWTLYEELLLQIHRRLRAEGIQVHANRYQVSLLPPSASENGRGPGSNGQSAQTSLDSEQTTRRVTAAGPQQEGLVDGPDIEPGL